MITIVSALKAEIAPLLQKFPIREKRLLACGSLYISDKIHFLRTGIGKKKADNVFGLYLEQFLPETVLNIGLAGKLNPDLKIAHIYNISTIFYPENNAIEINTLNKGQNASLFTSDEAVTSNTLRDGLFKIYGADLVDMEAYSLARICQNNKIPFYCTKIISDYANQNTENIFRRRFIKYAQKLSIYMWKNFLSKDGFPV